MILCAKIRFKSEKRTRTKRFLDLKSKKNKELFGREPFLTYLCANKYKIFNH